MILYLFDIDGTLLHAHGSGRDAFNAVFLEQHGLADASAGISYGGKTDGQLVDEIFASRIGRPVTAAERAAFLTAYLLKLRENVSTRGVEVIQGVVQTLDWLGARSDVHLGIATGNVREGAMVKLSAANLERWFAFGGYACDSHVRAELVAKAAARGRENRNVREVVVVGDTVHDIAAARAVGATVCAVATGSDSVDALAHADAVWTSMTELPAWHENRFG